MVDCAENEGHPFACLCRRMYMHNLSSQCELGKKSTNAWDAVGSPSDTRSSLSTSSHDTAMTQRGRSFSAADLTTCIPSSSSEPMSLFSQRERNRSCSRLGTSLPLDIPLRRDQPSAREFQRPPSGLPLRWVFEEHSDEETTDVDENLLTPDTDEALNEALPCGRCYNANDILSRKVEKVDMSSHTWSSGWSGTELIFALEFSEEEQIKVCC
mmetsp:Transcript_46159/g.107555  ORF Transcript_46159/g.107555 Transcript_46159/m.107555 type:complete len:212 (-) Transcript_46159:119-754(-)